MATGEAQRILDEFHAKTRPCPVCGKRLVPLKSGRVRHHNRDRWSGTFLTYEKCPGSGRTTTTPHS